MTDAKLRLGWLRASSAIRILTIPRHNPVNAHTLVRIVRDAGLTVEQFRDPL